MIALPQDVHLSPYLLPSPPESAGRVFLARAFTHYCALQWGHSADDIAMAFAKKGDAPVAARVELACQLLGGLMTRGLVRGWARAIGGGEPTSLRASIWELDDFTDRFGSSAIDLAHPFDGQSSPSHWLFVDLDDWNKVLEASVEIPGRARSAGTREPPIDRADGQADAIRQAKSDLDRLIRLPEVVIRTGLSRQTIYRRMSAGKFPRHQSLDGSISVWRESEVAAWIASPR